MTGSSSDSRSSKEAKSLSSDGFRSRIYETYVSDKMARVRQYGDEHYERWSQNTRRQIRGWLPDDLSAPVLDAGCGHGNMLHLLTSLGYRNVVGVDTSPEQIQLSSRISDDVELGDVFAFLERHTREFELITAFDLIEHFQKEEALEFVDLAFKSLRPGGSIVLQTPNADSPWLPSEQFNDITHELAFNPHSLEHLLSMVGFEQYEARETGPVAHGPASALRWLLWRGIRAGLAVWNLAETGSIGSGIYTRVFRARAIRP